MWPLISRGAVGWVSSFGDLTGVTRAAGVKRLELVPYSLAQVRTRPLVAGDPLHRNPDPSASVGADLKYAVTPALSLAATVNPDFGQVEADPAVVNLSAFEVFFQERRPFFIEGSGNYSFECRDCSMFYSRRIGRAPRGEPTLATDEYIDAARSIDDSRRRQTDRPCRRLLARRDGRGHPGRGRRHRLRTDGSGSFRPPPRDGGTADLLLGLARQARVLRPVVSGVHLHHHQPADSRDADVHPHGRHDRRRGLRLAPGTPLGPERLLGRQPRDGQPRGHRHAAAKHRAQLPAARRRSRRAGPAGRYPARAFGRPELQQAGRPAHTRQRRHRLQVSRVRSQRRRLHAPRRSHPPECLVADPLARTRQVRPQPQHQLQPVVVVQLRRRPAGSGIQFQRALAVPEPVEHRLRRQPQRRRLRRPADARRPRRPLQRQSQQLAVPSTPTIASC